MRKYIPIAAALAVVVLLGAAIMASGEVLSFSVPGAGDSVVERAPSGQVEPQDYYGEATRAFYFGPDFMCLIYGDTTTIECLAPTLTELYPPLPQIRGFSFIDGGETYACAYNRGENFHYCWGLNNIEAEDDSAYGDSDVGADSNGNDFAAGCDA